jgi:hypothetical protein
MGKIIHGINTPLVALAVMMHMTDSINDRVAHIEVAGCKINFCTERIAVILKFTGTHATEQIKALLDRTIPVRKAPTRIEALRKTLTFLKE